MTTMKQIAMHWLLAVLIGGFAAPSWAEQPVDTWEKVVFHVDEAANARWALMLARSYLEDRPTAKIVVVAYGPGIDFLLEDAEDRHGNPYDPAVTQLTNQGVDFRVCAATLSARHISKEDMLDAATIVPSGISEIARLQLKEGYAYLKP